MGYDYQGKVVGVTLKKSGYYKLEVWGGSGEKLSVDYRSGYGGYSYGKYLGSSGSVIYVVVGGYGPINTNSNTSGSTTLYPGGYNGGGQSCNAGGANPASSGGGATHIATIAGVLSGLSSYQGTYNSGLGTYDGGKILIVAGGGGGKSNWSSAYSGDGGGYIGGTGANGSGGAGPGTGGTQSSGGSKGGYDGQWPFGADGGFGYGGGKGANGSSYSHGCIGGGGGWYGGGGSAWHGSGGGSGYIGNSLLLQDKGMYMYNQTCQPSSAAATKTTCTNNVGAHVANAANTGNGYAKITYLGT